MCKCVAISIELPHTNWWQEAALLLDPNYILETFKKAEAYLSARIRLKNTSYYPFLREEKVCEFRSSLYRSSLVDLIVAVE